MPTVSSSLVDVVFSSLATYTLLLGGCHTVFLGYGVPFSADIIPRVVDPTPSLDDIVSLLGTSAIAPPFTFLFSFYFAFVLVAYIA
jgi:hypothetical protein